MTETDSITQTQAEWHEKHTLTPKDLKKMIKEKLERARIYSKAVERKRETVLQNDYR